MSKRLWVLPIMVVLLVAALGGLVQAMPSLSGPTGVVATPTAEIAPKDLASVVVSRQALKPGGEDLKNWELSALGSIGDQAELWLAYSSIKDTFDSHLWGVGAKAQVYKAPGSATTVAIGGGWYKWTDGLLSWVEGLPEEGQLKWANTTPLAVRNDILALLGFTVLPSVTVTATPSTVSQAGSAPLVGGVVALDAVPNNLGTATVDHWEWSVAPVSGAASIFDAPTGPTAGLIVNAVQMYQGDAPITYTVTAKALDASSALIAQGQANVVQMYELPIGAGAIVSVGRSLASMPLVTKDAAANMQSVKETLANSGAVGAQINPRSATAIALSKEDVKAWNAYAVATADLAGLFGTSAEWSGGGKLLGSVGVMYEKADPSIGDSFSLTRPFLNVKFEGAEGTALGLEYRWKDSDLDNKAVFSAVVSHAFTPQIAAELGTTNASPIGLGLKDQDWFVRVGFSFPLGGAAY